MNHEALVRTYVEGWKEGDQPKILGTLSPACLIIESHGPTYRGIKKVQEWVAEWFSRKDLVDRWDIISFHTLVPDKAIFEWSFECTVANKHYSIDGISMVHFEGGRISYLREYRTTEPLFDY
jgi:hypothetical protein